MIIDTTNALLKNFYYAMDFPSAWSSSALDLDNTLSMAGYNIPKFFHDYKLPDSKESLEQESNKMWLFSSPQYNISRIETLLGKKIEISNSLNLELEQIKIDTINKIIRLTEEIKIKNPELKDIRTPEIMDKIHFIRGAVYGYPPANIEHWVKNYKNPLIFNEINDHKNKIKETYNINTGLLRLTKEQADNLLKDLEEQSKTNVKFLSAKNKVNEKKCAMDDFGTLDPTGFLRFTQGRDDDL